MRFALHQELALAFMNERHRLGRRRVAVRRVDQLIASDIDPMLLGDSGDFGGRANQNGNDDA